MARRAAGDFLIVLVIAFTIYLTVIMTRRISAVVLKDSYKVYDHTPDFGKDYNEDLMHRQEQYRESRKEKEAPEVDDKADKQ